MNCFICSLSVEEGRVWVFYGSAAHYPEQSGLVPVHLECLPADRYGKDPTAGITEPSEDILVQVDGVSPTTGAPVRQNDDNGGFTGYGYGYSPPPPARPKSGPESWPGSSVRSAGRMDSHTVVGPIVDGPAVVGGDASESVAVPGQDWGWAIPSYGRRRGGRLGGGGRHGHRR